MGSHSQKSTRSDEAVLKYSQSNAGVYIKNSGIFLTLFYASDMEPISSKGSSTIMLLARAFTSLRTRCPFMRALPGKPEHCMCKGPHPYRVRE